MALRKPSNFFEDNNKSEVSESIKGTESFDTFQTYKKNVEKFDAISKFSGSLEDYNENVEKVNYLSQQLLGVQEEIKTLLTQEDLDRAMMSQLLVVEETAKDIQSRVKTINNERLVDIKENVKELTEQVNQFISIDVPKYKSLVINSENRSYSRYDEFEERISESINDIDSSIEQKYVEIDGRLNNFKTSVEENLSSIKVDVSKEVTTALESIESVNKNTINVVKAEFKETEVRTEEKINEVIDSYKKDIEDLNAKVKLFTETEIPKYSNLLIETKLKSEKEVKDLEEEVLSKVNILSEKVQFISEGIPEKTSEKIQELKAVTDEYKEEIDSISKKYQSLYKDFKEREVSENKKLETYSKDIEEYHKRFNFLEETVAEDLEEIQNVLAASNKSYHASLETEAVKFRDKISEQMKGLEVDLVTNEKHIKKQNEHIEDIREEIKGVFDKLQLDKLEEKNASLSRKVNYIQEVLEKFNEKEVLTESITEPTTTNNSDPLTPTDQNFVTFDQLQSHYRLFLNRIQQQLSTLGGGGEVRLEFLDDIDRSTAKVDGKFLKYDSSLNKWVGATGGSGGGGGGISGVSTTGTSGFNNVNVSGIITASSFVKTSGTSSQFLKADGSIDSSTYITSTDGGNADQLDGEEGTYYLDYSNFSNTPTIPSNNNQLTNGAGFITTSFTNTNQLTNGAGFITGSDNTTGTSGGLTGTPDITVDDITAGSINVSGVATAAAFHTGAEGSAIRVTSNTISGPATLTIDPAAVGDNTGTVVIAGDLQIDGTTTTVNSTTMTVDDKNLELGTGAANDAAADGGGITIVSGEGNKTFNFEATGDNLGSSENLNIASGKAYKINNTSVLNATTLGSAVVNSSLTSVGTLGALTVSGDVTANGNIVGDNATNISGINSVTAISFSGGTVAGSTGTFSNDVTINANLLVKGGNGSGVFIRNKEDTAYTIDLNENGSAEFAGNITSDGDVNIKNTTLKEATFNFSIDIAAGNNDIQFKSGGATFASFKGLSGNLELDGSVTAAGSVKSTNGTGSAFLGATSGTGLAINNSSNATVVEINYDGSATFSGTVSDSVGSIRYLGTSSAGDSDYTLVETDAGKQVRFSGSHVLTVPNNVFGTGAMITVVANSSSAVTINQGSGMTLYNAADGSSGNVTLAARTVCTILYVEGGGSSKAYIAGGGIS